MNAEPDEEVSLAIELGQMCQDLAVLPRAGGLFDQDYYHVILIRSALTVFAEKAQKDSDDKSKGWRDQMKHAGPRG